jgi:putative NADH-flavin reductase
MVLGASGQLGRRIVGQATIRGHRVTAQSRDAARLPAPALPPLAEPAAFHPADTARLADMLPGHDAVICALGVDHNGPSTLFSDTTRALISTMPAAGVRRLAVITGAGHGESCGPSWGAGGWLSSRLLAPLFVRQRHPDKDVAEELIAASDLDWTVIRPGPIAEGPLKGGLHAVWPVPPRVQVAAVTRDEVAEFVIDAVEQSRWRHRKPLVGHFA